MTAEELDPLVQRLAGSPVGRRWLLKALGVSIGAAAVTKAGWIGRFADEPAEAAPASEARTLQLLLGRVHGVSDLHVLAGGCRLPVRQHTKHTRAQLHTSRVFRSIPPKSLSHYVDHVPVPANRTTRISIVGRRNGRRVEVAHAFVAPAQAIQDLAKLTLGATGSLGALSGSAAYLSRLGVAPGSVRTPGDVVDVFSLVGAASTAAGIVMTHPQVATLDPTASVTTSALLADDPNVGALDGYIGQMWDNGEDWAPATPVTHADGSPVMLTYQGTTFQPDSIALNTTDPTFTGAVQGALQSGMGAVRDSAPLTAVVTGPVTDPDTIAGKTNVQAEDPIPQPVAYNAGGPHGILAFKILRTGSIDGLNFTVGTPNGATLPLRIYNNWVRWIRVYVQYLGPDGTNLSANPNAKSPDTPYATQLALLTPVSTMIGIPIVSENHVDVTLAFPPTAHQARILCCGAGHEVSGPAAWQQWFPTGAYPDRLYPDEATTPLVLETIFNVCLTGLLLCLHASDTATFTTIRSGIKKDPDGIAGTIRNTLESLSEKASSNSTRIASAVLNGPQATYKFINDNGADLSSYQGVWDLLTGLSDILPELFVSIATGQSGSDAEAKVVMAASLALIVANQIADYIPYLGFILSVMNAADDLITFTETATEISLSPFVTENEIALTYPATITVTHDPADAGFPRTARNWTLTPNINGIPAMPPTVGTLQTDGTQRSTPLPLSVDAPFGGTIQWTISIADAQGHQVGYGVSDKVANDNVNKPPTALAITITELPEPIVAGTTFDRDVTTSYNTAASGYRWSQNVPASDTETTRTGLAQIGRITVNTRAGLAGYTWSAPAGGNPTWYLRVVTTTGTDPQPQRGEVISFPRPPYLLFDQRVKQVTAGSLWLLAPNASDAGYQVRALTAGAGASVTWDGNASWGSFPDIVDAAAYHPSGHIVTLNSATARLAILRLPAVANTSGHAALARTYAGRGSLEGLLQAPVAVTVADNGTVVVLDAGAAQLSAFSLQGNPVRAFGTKGSNTYTCPLTADTQAHYLDIAADGSGHLYVLSTTNPATVAAYRVDVYTPAGVLVTTSRGINAAALAVDYWRNIFTLNYDPLAAAGTPHVDPALTVQEPSVSILLPDTRG